MLICIVGKSGSGKDTVARLLQKWYGLKPVCSYTTRLKRENETEGIEHYFITKEKAEEILKNRADEVVAKTVINDNIYFALKENLLDADIYVIDPKGIEYIKEHFPMIPLFQVYVHCDDEIAMQRAKDRGDDMEVYLSRHEDENEMFNKYYENGLFDECINNSNSLEEMKVELKTAMERLRVWKN